MLVGPALNFCSSHLQPGPTSLPLPRVATLGPCLKSVWVFHGIHFIGRVLWLQFKQWWGLRGRGQGLSASVGGGRRPGRRIGRAESGWSWVAPWGLTRRSYRLFWVQAARHSCRSWLSSGWARVGRYRAHGGGRPSLRCWQRGGPGQSVVWRAGWQSSKSGSFPARLAAQVGGAWWARSVRRVGQGAYGSAVVGFPAGPCPYGACGQPGLGRVGHGSGTLGHPGPGSRVGGGHHCFPASGGTVASPLGWGVGPGSPVAPSRSGIRPGAGGRRSWWRPRQLVVV